MNNEILYSLFKESTPDKPTTKFLFAIRQLAYDIYGKTYRGNLSNVTEEWVNDLVQEVALRSTQYFHNYNEERGTFYSYAMKTIQSCFAKVLLTRMLEDEINK